MRERARKAGHGAMGAKGSSAGKGTRSSGDNVAPWRVYRNPSAALEVQAFMRLRGTKVLALEVRRATYA